MPVSHTIKAAGRTLIGIGTRKATNRHWARSCHEFRYYENLVEFRDEAVPVARSEPEALFESNAEEALLTQGEASTEPADERVSEAAGGSPKHLVRRALRLLAEKKADVWVNKAEIWPMVKRPDPTFELAERGYTTISGMLKALTEI